jgi:hypothetical protein
VFGEILVALDGSENAEKALPKGYPLQGLPFIARAKEATDYLEGVQKKLLAEGISSKVHLSDRAPAEAITRAPGMQKALTCIPFNPK